MIFDNLLTVNIVTIVDRLIWGWGGYDRKDTVLWDSPLGCTVPVGRIVTHQR